MSLTRGGMGLVVLIGFVGLVISASNATSFIVLGAFVSLLLLNVPFAFLSVRGFSVSREHPSHVKEGDEMCVRLTVNSRARGARILLRFFDNGPGGRAVEPVQAPILPPGRTETLSYLCRAGRRGMYRFDSCRVESSSPFGFVNAGRRLRVNSDLVVYPIYYELMGAGFPFSRTHSGQSAAPGPRPGEGPSFFGLREYRHGDPIRKIHWPTTVRARAVMVKEFEEDMHSAVLILLDTRRDDIVPAGPDDNLERSVRVAASVANFTVSSGHPTTLAYFDESTGVLRADRAAGDLTPVLDGLARLQPSRMAPADLVTAGAAVAASGHSNWVVVLLSADAEGLAALLRARARGREIVAVIVDKWGAGPRPDAQDYFPAMLAAFERAGVGVILIGPEDDIQSALSRGMRVTRRMGI